MAELSSDKKYVTVEYGDTLSAIALEFLGDASKYTQLAAINDISDPNCISIGQKIYLSSKDAPAPESNKTTNSNKPKIKQFGLQSNADKTLFVTWSWDKSNTEHYRVVWYYSSGDGVFFVGSDSTTKYKQSLYTFPDNAVSVRVKIKPIAKKHTVNDKEVSYWTAEWSDYKKHYVEKPPVTPPVPTVDITEKNKLVASVDNLESDAKYIEFQIIKNNKSIVKNDQSPSKEVSEKGNTVLITLYTNVFKVKVVKSYASCQYTVDAGGEYKVRCRAVNGDLYSEWTDYSANVPSYPAAPKSIVELRARSATSVYISWNKVSTAENYTIQYTDRKSYFTSSPDNVQSKTIDSSVSHSEVTGLESGKEYFFRVRATNKKGDSGWTDIKSVVIGKKPSAPTTWSSTTTAMVGENVYLYWVHNSEDGSSQVTANLEITINDHNYGTTYTETIEVPNTATGDNKDKTSSYKLSTSDYKAGCEISWRVQTKGIHDSYSPWSTSRDIEIYSKPTVDVYLEYLDETTLQNSIVERFPFYIYGEAEPATQRPMEYHIEIVAKKSYETEDEIGNIKLVGEGEVVYSKHGILADSKVVNTHFFEELTAGNVDLKNGQSYRVNCTVSFESGLTATDHVDFEVSWGEIEFVPSAQIIIDRDKMIASINPYCISEKTVPNKVVEITESIFSFITGATIDKNVYGTVIENVFTDTGKVVYRGVDWDGEDVTYAYKEEITDVEDVTLSVYRREYDGTFTEIETDIRNNKTFVTDPHPSLDYARYRIVATSTINGDVSYADIPAVPVGEHAVIIQWDERYQSFESINEDELEDQIHTSSMIRIPYNIDVSDNNDPDVSLIEYIGRKHPVSYYGTQLGEKSTWNVEIPKDDVETLHSLRRLKNWMGDVYVREPSGSGYWANIQVSFSIKHKETTIPVTFSITRVEGGI